MLCLLSCVTITILLILNNSDTITKVDNASMNDHDMLILKFIILLLLLLLMIMIIIIMILLLIIIITRNNSNSNNGHNSHTQYIKTVKFMTISQESHLARILTISHNFK